MTTARSRGKDSKTGDHGARHGEAAHSFGELLAPLSVVPWAAFRADSKCPQEVCNFVLALTLAHNDFSSVLQLLVHLHKQRPKGAIRQVTRAEGLAGSYWTSALRLWVGIISELLALIRKQSHVLELDWWRAFEAQIPTQPRQDWDELVRVALQKLGKKRSPLANALDIVRNHVSFHYDPEHLQANLEAAITNGQVRRLFASRGLALESTRFFYADMAAERAIVDLLTAEGFEDFLLGTGPLVAGVNQALHVVATGFVIHRGFKFKQVAEPAQPIL